MKTIPFAYILLCKFINFIIINGQFSATQNYGGAHGTGQDQRLNDLDKKTYLKKGWLKYFVYIPDFKTPNRPTKFEYNQAYYEQFSFGRNASFNPNDRDENGWFDIPDDTHLYFILSARTFYAISARRNDMAKTVRSFEIDWLLPMYIDYAHPGVYKGGIEDLGNYREGFCWKLTLKTTQVWNVCADTLQEKTEWIQVFQSIMIHQDMTAMGQGASDIISHEINLPINFATNPQPPLPEKYDPIIPTNGSRVNGRWVILQDWSQCSLACGGGKQYLQRMCVPPLNGGEPCFGPNILDRDCNIQPCPNVISHQTEGQLPTVVRMQRISNRPQRYEVCIIKEGDMDLLLKMEGMSRGPRFPVRVVLNNKTLTIFTTVSYDSVYMSFDLNQLKVKLEEQDPVACFEINDNRDPKKKVSLCSLPLSIKPSQSISENRDEWIHDINFFKEKCKQKDLHVNIDPLLDAKRKQLAMEEQDSKWQRIQEDNANQKEVSLEKEVASTSHIAMQALEKEMRYEQLAIKEEQMREKEDERNIAKSVNSEKERQDCLERELKKKQKLQELENQRNGLSGRIGDIQNEIILQVKAARGRTSEKIAAMKRAAERKRRDGQRQVEQIRSQMAESLISDNMMGNETNCLPSQSTQERKQYCTKNFENNPDKYRDCTTSALDFCYVCCEKEFGRMHEKLRQKCYKICDSTKQKGDGTWVWVPQANSVK